MTGRHVMREGDDRIEVSVPVSGGENVMVPVIRAVVSLDTDPTQILLQRRDVVSEYVRGSLEIPGGRWRAGESPLTAISREVSEETGVTLVAIDGVAVEDLGSGGSLASIIPLVVVAGIDGAFPASHMVVTAIGTGTPRPEVGETADVRWWPLDEVRTEMQTNREGFIPSSYAALAIYIAVLDAAS
ncbi:MAG: NUDIX hydrolase [Acidimicrobiia bacterium]